VAHGSFLRGRAPLLSLAAALCLLTLAAYSNSFRAGFTLDSRQAILGDERIRAAASANFDLILNHTYWWPYDQSGLYRPLTTLSYLFNYAILGNRDHPAGYHWVNLLLHIGNVLLVLAIARKLNLAPLPGFLAAALWAVHPVLTESVTNIVGRADLLAGLGVLGGFLMYLRGGAVGYAGVALGAAVASFSKESGVVLPGIILLYEFALGRRFRRALGGSLAACVPIALMLYQRTEVLAGALPPYIPFTDNPLAGADFFTGRVTALAVLGRYVWLLVWPARLSADYSWAQVPPAAGRLEEWLAWATLATVVAAIALALRRGNRTALFLAGFAFLTILPTSNLLFPVGTVMAERFLYLPGIAFAIAIALAADAVHPKAAAAILSVAVLALAARTWTRNLDWRDDMSMAQSLARTSPASFKAHRLLASQLLQQHAPIDQVAAEAEKSLAPIDPLPDSQNSADTWRLAAGYFFAKGDYARTVTVLRRCLAIVRADQARANGATYPGLAEIYATLAMAYEKLNRPDDAAIALMEGQFTTGDLAFRKNLLTLYQSGLDTQGCAVVPGPAGPALNPSCEIVHRHLCAALAATGKTEELSAYGCR
jgi:protein O-mannosyl-transferase